MIFCIESFTFWAKLKYIEDSEPLLFLELEKEPHIVFPLIFALFPLLLFGQTPDRAPKPEEWGYRPADGAVVAVNPPALSWVSDARNLRFSVQWSRSADFSAAVTVDGIPWSVYTHNRPLAPGVWYWRYRIVPPKAQPSAWSRARKFTIATDAVEFPQPSTAELAARIPKDHPRLFVTVRDLPRLRAWAQGGGAKSWQRVLQRADQLLSAEPTPEPTEMGTISNPQTVQFWWSNRVQTQKACMEAEALAFAYLLTGEKKYGDAARRWVLHLASWNPDGPTNWRLNDEAAMPILHRLARAYDWAYAALSDAERKQVRAALLRRAQDVWKAGQTGEGAGHLNMPYNSHGNRSWHKLAENAIATFGDTPESAQHLDFAVSKFFAAYPVWSDDDGGWHEGLAYWASYMSKATWWLDVARTSLGIDGFKKPFFEHVGDYALYTAPPGVADMGFGDLAARPPSSSWNFVHYFAAAAGNPYWAWWAAQWKINPENEEPVLGFLWSALPRTAPKAPVNLPPSKLFRGIGVAILNNTLLDSAANVQVRFKSSPFGRQSHGHDAHNSFTLDAYGDALLVNNVYRDLYGSPFHKEWCWSTKAQNAMLVDGEGQKPHSASPDGSIVRFESKNGVDYTAGDATAAYGGKLKRYLRHVIFVKPDVVIIADEVEAEKPATFQFMLHGGVPFTLDETRQSLGLERVHGGVRVDYIAAEPLRLKQWTGYDPEPNWKYLKDATKTAIPPQWHVEASTATPATKALVVAVLRPYKKGAAPSEAIRTRRSGAALIIEAGGKTITLGASPEFYSVR